MYVYIYACMHECVYPHRETRQTAAGRQAGRLVGSTAGVRSTRGLAEAAGPSLAAAAAAAAAAVDENNRPPTSRKEESKHNSRSSRFVTTHTPTDTQEQETDEGELHWRDPILRRHAVGQVSR
eukprot:GHVU01088066.1.p3 GENE.GHVU01088066.1~~GHVU01088066.1.p3  ORF type:complete len:123 (-),score=20.49 GHVU01088066.1:11-379(-)